MELDLKAKIIVLYYLQDLIFKKNLVSKTIIIIIVYFKIQTKIIIWKQVINNNLNNLCNIPCKFKKNKIRNKTKNKYYLNLK